MRRVRARPLIELPLYVILRLAFVPRRPQVGVGLDGVRCDVSVRSASRHIDRTLGAPINTFVIAAKTCIRVLREEDAKEVGNELDERASEQANPSVSFEVQRWKFPTRTPVLMMVYVCALNLGQAMARLGAGKHNRLVRMLLYVVFFIRGIPEALKVRVPCLVPSCYIMSCGVLCVASR